MDCIGKMNENDENPMDLLGYTVGYTIFRQTQYYVEWHSERQWQIQQKEK